jgi:hypothetical protein
MQTLKMLFCFFINNLLISRGVPAGFAILCNIADNCKLARNQMNKKEKVAMAVGLKKNNLAGPNILSNKKDLFEKYFSFTDR